MEINGRFGVEIKDKFGNLVRKIENSNTVSNLGILQMKRWLDRNEYVAAVPDNRNYREPSYCAGEFRRVCLLPKITVLECTENENPYSYPIQNAFDGQDVTMWHYWHDMNAWQYLTVKFGEPINLKGFGINMSAGWSQYQDGHTCSTVFVKTEGASSSGAGTSAYNSVEWLRARGTYNGKKYYKQDGASYYMFSNADNTKWQMAASLGGTVMYQTTTSSWVENPWGLTWETQGGAANPPTVTEGTSSWRYPHYKDAAQNQNLLGADGTTGRQMVLWDPDVGYNGDTKNYRMRTFEGVEGLYTASQSPMWYGYIPFVTQFRIADYCDDKGDKYHNTYAIDFYEALMHPQNPYALKLGTDDGTILPLAASNTALGAYSAGMQWKCHTVTQPTGYTVRFSRALTGDEANGVTFKEIGLYMNADGHLESRTSEPKLANATELFARSIFSSPWSKTADQTATIYYEITVS